MQVVRRRRLRTQPRRLVERRKRVVDPPVPQALASGGDQILISGHLHETACASTRSAPDAREAKAEHRRKPSCCSGIPQPTAAMPMRIVARDSALKEEG